MHIYIYTYVYIYIYIYGGVSFSGLGTHQDVRASWWRPALGPGGGPPLRYGRALGLYKYIKTCTFTVRRHSPSQKEMF